MKYMVLLASKYVKRQKFRTTLTFLGITLAAFILSISLFIMNSLEVSMKQYFIDSIGSWEVSLVNCFNKCDDKEQAIEVIKENALVSDYYISRTTPVAFEADTQNIINCYYEVTDGKGDCYKPTRLIIERPEGNEKLIGEGLYLNMNSEIKNEDEAFLPVHYREIGYKAGDRITLTFVPVNAETKGEAYTRQFTIAGFCRAYVNDTFFDMTLDVKDPFADELTALNSSMLKKTSEQAEAFLRINDKADFEKSVINLIDQAFDGKVSYQDLYDEMAFNSFLLLFEFKALILADGFAVIVAFLFAYIFLVWLIARFIIDNTFEISVAERNRKFNVLRTLGASKGQLTALTIYEAAFYCLTSVPLGTLLAYLVLKWLFSSFRKVGVLQAVFSVHPLVFAAGILLCMVSILISSYTSAIWPTRKMTLVQAMNYGVSAKRKKNKKIKKNKKLYKSPSKLIWTYTKRNIGRTKGKFIFSAFAGSVSVIMLVVMIMMSVVVKNMTVSDVQNSRPDYIFYEVKGISYNEIKDYFGNEDCFADVQLSSVKDYYRMESKAPVSDKLNYVSDETALKLDKISGNELSSYFYGLLSENDFYRSVSQYFNLYDETDIKKVQKDTLFSITGMSYEEFRNSGSSILVVVGDKKASYRKMSRVTEVEFDNHKFSISGVCYVKSEYAPEGFSSGYVLTSADNMADEVFESADILLKVSDGAHYEESLEICSKFNDDYSLFYYENNYLSATGLDSFINAIYKIALVLFIFLWLTSIVSMINLTNTRIMNSQREYFIFRCTGMTKKQLVVSVLLEVIIFSVLSTVIGGVLGTLFFTGLFISVPKTGMEYNEVMTYLNKTIVPVAAVFVISVVSNILIPAVFSLPLISRLFTTSSDVVNSNDIR